MLFWWLTSDIAPNSKAVLLDILDLADIKRKRNEICTYRLPDLGYDTTNTSSDFVWKLERNCSSFAGLPVLRVAIFNPLIL